MKVKSLVLAVAAATATFATASAFAQGVTTALIGAVPVGTTVTYFAGASAQTPGLEKAALTKCGAGTFYVYKTTANAGATPSAGFIYACAAGANSFVWNKRDTDGSFDGVSAVAGSVQRSFVNENALPAPAVYPAIASVNGTGVLQTVDIAFSDVEKRLWESRNQLTAAQSAGLTQTVLAGQGFGLAVSDELYRLLQADQGLAVGSLDAKDQPVIGRAVYASLATTKTNIWKKLLPDTAAGLPANLTLSRRVATSGTQAASDVYFGGFGCGGVYNPNTAGVFANANGAGFTLTVKENSSTGGVRTDLAAAGAAIGVLSLENKQPADNGAAGGPDWKYVKVEASPTYYLGAADATQRQNAIDAAYDFALEAVALTKAPTPAALTAIVNGLKTDFGDGNQAVPGLYSIPTPGTPAAQFALGGTSHYTRSGNSCAPLSFVK